MSLSVEQLMQPRYKVIQMWPDMGDNGYQVGEILLLTGENKGQRYAIKNGNHIYDAFFDTFPHLFEPLPWWAERQKSDMPEYIAYSLLENSDAKCMKKAHRWQWDGNNAIRHIWPDGGGLLTDYIKPVSQEEYTREVNALRKASGCAKAIAEEAVAKEKTIEERIEYIRQVSPKF